MSAPDHSYTCASCHCVLRDDTTCFDGVDHLCAPCDALLFPPSLLSRIPALYSQEDTPDPIVYAHLAIPRADWHWLVTEYDPDARECFTLCVGFEVEWGYTSIEELETLEVQGLRVLRVRMAPQPLSVIAARLGLRRVSDRLYDR